ncbi:tRNA1(Val) (adenine(37)-N6)-methyltransferase [Salegentibacter salegens]|uniref:tRNA1(Val) (adenine(37)-N6)-methyltransferase n=1 Tax=Salegentibacter salegens TaxID=143223 RepID=A0A1M7LSQ9_9FLAO|nr:methyltransferase [Salegentibacter salegens]PRX52204.1 tRNA1Val (adenine37-N6)-methyltransferase [Salegentibacter salegens]SHM81115.1 tRNA1Val (adenine37-N6)-methyltransferase [Salegentibacter salegens]
MSEKAFQFKEFSIEQDRCAMKIGTDGVLLGAWASMEHQPNSILDIGTGTGLIALMLAQRSPALLIDALEIDEDAYEQAVDNFEQSNWGDRLFCYHAAFDEFVEEMQDEEKYELIISNPPFYSEDYTSENASRNKARFAEALPFSELVEGVSKLLHPQGEFNTIIPHKEETDFITLAREFGLFPKKITRVRGNETSAIKRSLLSFNFKKEQPEKNELIIEISRHNYTDAYKKLVKDFYLKL